MVKWVEIKKGKSIGVTESENAFAIFLDSRFPLKTDFFFLTKTVSGKGLMITDILFQCDCTFNFLKIASKVIFINLFSAKLFYFSCNLHYDKSLH